MPGNRLGLRPVQNRNAPPLLIQAGEIS